jgi:phosphoadenosine phosphosulfate reductase
MFMILVIGLDAATWKIIEPNAEKMPNLHKLMKEGKCKTLPLKERPHSASVWCSIFSGKTQKEHGHKDFVVDGNLQTREDIKVKFVWDVLDRLADIRALNVPFVYPPYNFNCDYKPIGYGLSSDPKELEQDMKLLTQKAKEILRENPDVFIVVYTMLDKISHFHWGEPFLLEWYGKVDRAVGELLKFAEKDKIIVISDHGFCDWDEVEEHTLPKETPEGKIKGDHYPEAILISKNINFEINSPEDVYHAIKSELNLSFEDKVNKSKEILREALQRFEKIGIAWTTGKDSTAILHLIKETFGKVSMPVLHGDTTVKFKEIYDFRDKIAEQWGLNLIVVKPEIPEGFEIASDREKCCHLLKTIPMQKKIKELGLEAVIVGIRWDEQKARAYEDYFSYRKNHCRIHPILHWTEEDVWRYTKERNVPVNPLYEKGYRSLGCEPCTKPTPEGGTERSGRSQDKEKIMERLRALGYW